MSVWQHLTDLIIRPLRCQYDIDYGLGRKFFSLAGENMMRVDFQVMNPRGMKLQCSRFSPLVVDPNVPATEALEKRCKPAPGRRPCVIYCHGNCGSRCDGFEAALCLLPSGIDVVCFDFSGSGLSDGDFVSLGYFEVQDLMSVMEHLRSTGSVSRVGIWGRSMGAATAIMYAAKDPSVAGIVLDSPFAKLSQVMIEVVKNYKSWIPKVAISLAIKAMRKSIIHRAHFDILEVDPLKWASMCFVPALFGHGEDDDFVRPHNTQVLVDAYGGDKNYIKLNGHDHNSARPEWWLASVTIFFHNLLFTPEEKVTLSTRLQEISEALDREAAMSVASSESTVSAASSTLLGGSSPSLAASSEQLAAAAAAPPPSRAPSQQPTTSNSRKPRDGGIGGAYIIPSRPRPMSISRSPGSPEGEFDNPLHASRSPHPGPSEVPHSPRKVATGSIECNDASANDVAASEHGDEEDTPIPAPCLSPGPQIIRKPLPPSVDDIESPADLEQSLKKFSIDLSEEEMNDSELGKKEADASREIDAHVEEEMAEREADVRHMHDGLRVDAQSLPQGPMGGPTMAQAN